MPSDRLIPQPVLRESDGTIDGGAGPTSGFSASRYLVELSQVLTQLDTRSLERMANRIDGCAARGGTVFCVGNGGSASTAGHLAADLMKLTAVGCEARLRVLSLAESPATLTAAANDVSYDEAFVETLRCWLRPGDVVIALSTSGRSPNVLRAAEYAQAHGASVLVLTGSTGHPLAALADETLMLGSDSVQRVEDASLVASHLLCMMVRERRALAGQSARISHETPIL